MGSKWERVYISDVCELIVDCVNKTAPIVDYQTDFKMLRTPNIKNGCVDTNSCRFVDEKTFEKWTRRAKVKKNDVLLTREAPLGEVGIVSTDENLFLGQRIMQYRADISKLDPHFLLYSFLSPYLQAQFKMHEGSGSVVSHIRVGDCSKFKIKLPPLQEQQRISAILKVLDDKITLNQEMNKTLEAMAQALFKSWFVDFEPFKDNGFVESELGKIPKGWRIATLDDCITFMNGYAFKSKELLGKEEVDCYKVFKMGHILKGGGFNSTGTKSWIKRASCTKIERYILKEGDLLMCMTDMKGNVALLGHTALMNEDDKYIVNQRVGLLRPNNSFGINYPFLFMLTNYQEFLENLRSRANSGVQVNLSTSEIKKSKFILAPDAINKKFDAMVKPLFNTIFQKQYENKKLIKLRDILLPKLINGEINV